MPEEGIVHTMPAKTEGWLLQSLDLSDIEEVRNGGQVFNFKDHQRFHSRFPDEEITIMRRQV